MPSVLLIHPDPTFFAISAEMIGSGWIRELVPRPPPLLQGEPELAWWQHEVPEGRAIYSFNPASRLRELVVSGPAAEELAEALRSRLPTLGLEEVRAFFLDEVPARRLLACQAASLLGATSLLAWLDILARDPDPIVAAAAVHARAELRTPRA